MGSSEKDLVPITGLLGSLFTSMSGAKSVLKPTADISSPIIMPVISALFSASEVAPIAIFPVIRVPEVSLITIPPSSSTDVR